MATADREEEQDCGKQATPPSGHSISEAAMHLAPLIDSVMDAILVVDEQQRIVVFNRAAECIFRCQALEAMGQTLNKFIPERFHRAHEKHVQRYMRNGTTTRSMALPGHIAGLRADGTEFPAEATIAHGESGGKKFCAVILRDITERLQAAELRQMLEKAQREEESRLYEHEIEIAASFQRRLISSVFPEVSFATVRGQTRPCREVGGDFFEVLSTADRLTIVLADACGKGISAALIASILHGLAYSQLSAGVSLSRIAESCNRFLCEKASTDYPNYATMIIAHLHRGGELELLNCGHIRPLLISAGRARAIQQANLPVGLFPDTVYESATLTLARGDRVVLLTDGISDAENRRGESFGTQVLEAELSGGGTIERVLDAMSEFCDGWPPHDDCTILEVAYQAAAQEAKCGWAPGS